ncbi:alpha/beta hydrolase, partial [Xanthomonas citri pv. citri]|nr:alpha/beta hydrolase [Xanthomonas citri pv. citri]
AHLTNFTAMDLPTGHWPMWSRPQELAEAIREAATSTS